MSTHRGVEVQSHGSTGPSPVVSFGKTDARFAAERLCVETLVSDGVSPGVELFKARSPARRPRLATIESAPQRHSESRVVSRQVLSRRVSAIQASLVYETCPHDVAIRHGLRRNVVSDVVHDFTMKVACEALKVRGNQDYVGLHQLLTQQPAGRGGFRSKPHHARRAHGTPLDVCLRRHVVNRMLEASAGCG
jgi:hypothetical protein